MEIDFKKTAWVIFILLVGYSVGMVVSYHDKKVIVDYAKTLQEECFNNSERVGLYKEITPTGVDNRIYIQKLGFNGSIEDLELIS